MLPRFEAAFNDTQRAVWQSAEKLAGLKPKASNGGKKKAKTSHAEQSATTFLVGFGAAAQYAGMIAGHAFRTGHRGTGYYVDTKPCAAVVEDDRPEARPEQGDDAGGPTDRAQRSRDSEGKRSRKKARKKIANSAKGTPYVCEEANIDDDRWWVRHGWWAIDSVNPNSWTTAKSKVLNV